MRKQRKNEKLNGKLEERLKKNLPPEGNVRAIFVTRAQWERAFVINGSPATETEPEALPEQIQLW